MKLQINLDKITHNSAILLNKTLDCKLDLMAVTKGCLGNIKLAKAMEKGGIKRFGDSRVENIKKLLKADFKNISLIRQPTEEEVKKLTGCDINIYISTYKIAKLLSEHAISSDKKKNVVLMIETGDCREGFLVSEVKEIYQAINDLPNLKIKGIATNIACATKVKTGLGQLNELAKIADRVALKSNNIISGANSSSIPLIEKRRIPSEITEARLGEAILLGQETIDFTPIKDCFQDSFLLISQILEVREKCGRKQILIYAGKQDIGAGKIKPYGFNATFINSTSDHIIFSVDDTSSFKQGQILKFIPSYYALVCLMASPYVKKQYTKTTV